MLLTGQTEEPVGVRAQAQTRANLLPRPPSPEQTHPCCLSSFRLNAARPHHPQLLQGPPKGQGEHFSCPAVPAPFCRIIITYCETPRLLGETSV